MHHTDLLLEQLLEEIRELRREAREDRHQIRVEIAQVWAELKRETEMRTEALQGLRLELDRLKQKAAAIATATGAIVAAIPYAGKILIGAMK